jgi:DNA-3-methyladenine glycosylase II
MPADLPDPLSALALTVVGQLISRQAARAIFARLVDLLGGSIDAERLAASSDATLRSIGLSYAKARALRELAQAVVSGELDFETLAALSDDQVLARLVGLRGVGPWSAQVFMLRQLHRPDVFPAGDIGLRHAIAMLDDLPVTPTVLEAEARALAWQPYRSYAAGYLWRSYADGVTRA